MIGSMRQSWLVVGGSIGFLLVSIHTIWIVKRQYRERGQLSNGGVIEVWALYLLHALLVGVAAWFSVWLIAINRIMAMIAGILLLVAGLAMIVAAMQVFQSMRRVSGQETDKLVTGGIYHWSRNPQNVGWLLALLGMAIWGRSGGALLLVALFAMVVHVYITQVEEDYLEGLYGHKYRDYWEMTPRYLGWPSDRRRNQA